MSRFWTLLIFIVITIFIFNIFYQGSGPSISKSFSKAFRPEIPDSYEKAKQNPDANPVPYAEYLNKPPKRPHSKPDVTATFPFAAPSSTATHLEGASSTPTSAATSATSTSPTNVGDVKSSGEKADFPARSGHSLNVAIIETNPYHDEVVAALVHSFGSQENVTLHVYQETQRYGIKNIMEAFKLPKPVPTAQPPSLFEESEDDLKVEIVVLTTCEIDLLHLASKMQSLLAARKTYLFCVVHHADRWEGGQLVTAILPWVEAGMVDFVTLSSHTALFFEQNAVPKWDSTASVTIRSFAPVFPVQLSNSSQATGVESTSGSKNLLGVGELSLVIQGNYEMGRRDIGPVFSQLEKLVEERRDLTSSLNPLKKLGNKANVTLHLIGDGDKKPEIPDSLINHVFFDQGLSYVDYYTVISRAFATLPAFANDEYLDRKASSTIPAALIGGSPLVVTQNILDAYSYLPEEVVYLQKAPATEMDVVIEALGLGEKGRRKKARHVRVACEMLIEENTKAFGEWLAKAEKRLDM